MSNTPIRFDLAHTLQPFPLDIESAPPVDNLAALGEELLDRNLSPHAAVSTGMAGNLRLTSAGTMSTPTAGMQAAHESIIRWKQHDGIIRLVPDDDALGMYAGVAEDIGLLNGFRLPIEDLLTQDRRKTLVLSSPNGISGQLPTVQEIVRLIRHFSLVVLDERLAPFSMRRLTPLVVEWENVISVQSFPFVMPGQKSDFGWIVHPTDLAKQLAVHIGHIPEKAVANVLEYGGIETWRAERTIARRKSQLFREMRKLSILSVPYPSWSNSLLARIERGNRDEIVRRLAASGIAVYAPPHPNLRQHMRITAVSNDATLALRDTLVEINRDL